MKRRFVRSAASGAVLLLGAAACTQNDTAGVQEGVDGGSGGYLANGGTGGSSLQAGAGGSGAAPGGAGGSGGAMPEAGTERFVAVLTGERVLLTTSDSVWLKTCDELNPRLVQRSGDVWTLLRDERPEASNLLHAAHYLDAAYHSDCALSLGCDAAGCTPLAEFPEDAGQFQSRMTAREYVQVGQLGAPACNQEDAGLDLDAGGDAGGRLVPNIESRAPSGPLAVRLRYFRDDRCQSGEITTDIVVE